MPGPKPRLHLPWQDWPEIDRRLWTRAFGDDDPFADDTAVHLSKSSKENCHWAHRRFLGFIKKHDPEAIDLQPHQRLTPDRVKAFARHLAESTQPASRAASIDALYRAARFMMPRRDWAWLKKIKTRLQRAVRIKSAKGPVVTSVQLLDLGERLMKEAKTILAQSFQNSAAAQYRDGLIVALAAFHPFRPKNLIALELDRHVRFDGARWFIFVPADETKTGADIDFEVSQILVPYLAYYLDNVRPKMIRDRQCKSLWISTLGGPFSYEGLVKSFVRLSERLKARISPHDVRDAAATLWAIAAPDQIGVARDLLTHRDLGPMRHYNRARGIEASRAYRRVISELRKKSIRPADS